MTLSQEDVFEPVSPTVDAVIAPIGHDDVVCDLVGLKEKVEQAKKDLVETEIDIEEADAPKVHSRIYTPSPDEFNKHCATHLPYRNWCPICVKAKRKNPSHRKTDAGQHKHVPVLSMDYMFMNEKTDDYNFPILVLRDSGSEGVLASFVKREGNYSEYVSKRIAEIANWLGYTKVVFKTDQEPAIKDVMHDAKTKIWKDMDAFHEQVKNYCACQITVLQSPVGESQANCVVENAIQRIQGQIRAIKLDVESSSDTKMAPTHPAWPWMIEIAAQSILYWRISGDGGLTAIQRIRGRSTTSPKPRFGEKILYKLSTTIKLGKSEARWRYGGDQLKDQTSAWSEQIRELSSVGLLRLFPRTRDSMPELSRT